MLNDLTLFFVHSVQVSLLVSIFIFVTNWKIQYKVFNYLGIFILLNVVTELLVWGLSTYYYRLNNLPLLHIYTLGEFILFSLFYKALFKSKLLKDKYINAFVFSISILIILNSIFLQSIWGFNSYAKTLVQCILIGYALIYFVKVDAKIEKRTITDKARLMVNVGVLIYYSGSLFVFMFSDFFLRYGNGLHESFWMFNAGLNLIFQLIILSAIWKVFKNRKSIY